MFLKYLTSLLFQLKYYSPKTLNIDNYFYFYLEYYIFIDSMQEAKILDICSIKI